MSLRISQVIAFLQDVKTTQGDLKVQGITGFWTGETESKERVVMPVVGDGQTIEDLRQYARKGAEDGNP